MLSTSDLRSEAHTALQAGAGNGWDDIERPTDPAQRPHVCVFYRNTQGDVQLRPRRVHWIAQHANTGNADLDSIAGFERSQTVVGIPAAIRLRAIAEPMMPLPITATRV